MIDWPRVYHRRWARKGVILEVLDELVDKAKTRLKELSQGFRRDLFSANLRLSARHRNRMPCD